MSVRVAPAPGKGRGLFATRAFSPGETILTAPVALIERAGLPGELARYAFTWTGGQRAIAFGLVSLCNHHDTPKRSARAELASPHPHPLSLHPHRRGR